MIKPSAPGSVRTNAIRAALFVSSGHVGAYTSLDLDADEYPHISYHDTTSGDLKYARWDGSQWRIETVDREGRTGSHTSLKLDKNGRPHISYYDGRLRYARYDGSQWHAETVDGSGDVGKYSSLEIDEEGQVHISYYDSTNGDLKYAIGTAGREVLTYLACILNGR